MSTAYYVVEVLRRGFPLFVVLAVLVQYTPLRICALENVAFGSSCHDRGDHAVLGDANVEKRPCGSSTDGEHNCACEQPKVDGQHDQQGLKSLVDWTNVPIPAIDPIAASTTPIPALPDPDPHRGASVALQFPLLI